MLPDAGMRSRHRIAPPFKADPPAVPIPPTVDLRVHLHVILAHLNDIPFAQECDGYVRDPAARDNNELATHDSSPFLTQGDTVQTEKTPLSIEKPFASRSVPDSKGLRRLGD
ncbi:hypothetical protein [Cohnella rhizosphaerae]|uniref:Uncharacterized protein n=1 Tax=Cohnella rhizosphaerae TaxID=1457232 RepID=A0A9X4KRP6_9BACL|nr:hypothetical protein [Cohnella rhizosphaerae]MDG0809670.1 hypothetical protein [Cohnella rhizosphaerae]